MIGPTEEKATTAKPQTPDHRANRIDDLLGPKNLIPDDRAN